MLEHTDMASGVHGVLDMRKRLQMRGCTKLTAAFKLESCEPEALGAVIEKVWLHHKRTHSLKISFQNSLPEYIDACKK